MPEKTKIVTNRDGTTTTLKLVEMTNSELASRLAIWIGIKLDSFKRISEKHKSLTYNWIELTSKNGNTTKLTLKQFQEYFLYVNPDTQRKQIPLIKWSKTGIYFYEDQDLDNCWLLANIFYI